MIIQLKPELFVYTPKGEGMAWMITDYGIEHNKVWTVALRDGQVMDFCQRDITRPENLTYGIKEPNNPERTSYYGY
jgi:hypothetical protein